MRGRGSEWEEGCSLSTNNSWLCWGQNCHFWSLMEQAFLNGNLMMFQQGNVNFILVVFNVNVSQGLCKDKVSLYIMFSALAQSWIKWVFSDGQCDWAAQGARGPLTARAWHDLLTLTLLLMTVLNLSGTLPSWHSLCHHTTTTTKPQSTGLAGAILWKCELTWRDPGSVCFVWWNWQQLKSIYLENPQR